ncbi:ParA family protein [Altererythrobacter sp.]|nr:ParA family protein [Altererythrobacter sp.]
MAVVALYSVKGGVGKTTLAANLAWCAAETSKRRTLLWDLDAAGGAAFLLGVGGHKKKRADSIFSLQNDPAKLVRRTGYEQLDVLPADESLRDLDRQLSQIGRGKRISKLSAALSKTYERIIFDCPPVMNEISVQVIKAADLIIVPIPPSPLSARAFEMVVGQVTAHTKKHPPILPVLSMLDMRRNLHRAAREANPRWPVIPQASAVEQCAVHQMPVGAFAPTSPAAQSMHALWKAIERKLAKVNR